MAQTGQYVSRAFGLVTLCFILATWTVCDGDSYYPESCVRPSGNDCSWYRECLEKRYPCEASKSPYAITFAEKMCLEFGDSYSKFSPKGKKWIDGVRRCLVHKMASYINKKKSPSCSDIKARAFASHAKCYLYPGPGAWSVCDLSLADMWRLFWTIKGAFLDATEDIIKGFLEVVKGCIESRL